MNVVHVLAVAVLLVNLLMAPFAARTVVYVSAGIVGLIFILMLTKPFSP